VSTPPLELVAALSRAVKALSARREGRETRFLCPAHDDHSPSARWNPEKAVWRCDACGAGGGALDLAERLGIELPAVRAQGPCETVYRLRDAAGRVVAEHVRVDLGNGKKRMFWRREGRRGLGGLRTADLPLYGAEHVRGFDASRPVFVVEGEKAAECLLAIGAQVLGTVSGASGTPSRAALSVLAGYDLILWPDADTPGAQHMRRLGAAVAGVAASVRIFEPAGAQASDDAAEWTAARLEEKEPAAVLVSLLAEVELDATHPAGVAAGGAGVERESAPALSATSSGPASAPPLGSEEVLASRPGSGSLVAVGTVEPPSERAWPELDPRALHGVAGSFVRLIEPDTEADPVALLVQFLAAAGSLLGRHLFYQVEGAKHFPNLFTLLVGETSRGRKGTSLAHVRNVMAAADATWDGTRVLSGLSSGEGLIHQVRDPAEPRADAKGKAADEGIDDKRLFVVESEFATSLRVMHREGNTLSGILRSAWETGALATLTKNTPTTAKGAHISLVGHITADELRRELDRTEYANGLANRFLFVVARRARLLPFGGESVNMTALSSIARQLVEAAGAAQQRHGQRLCMDSHAVELWREVYPVLSADRRGFLGALTARAEAHAVRLAVLYAILDAAPAIQGCHLVAALALWAYCDESTQYIFGDSLGDPDSDAILSGLQRSADGLTRTEVRDLFGRHRSASQIDRAIYAIQRDGLVSITDEPTGGRPIQRLKLATKATKATKGSAEGGLMSLKSLLSRL
jgi:hypothetical protein